MKLVGTHFSIIELEADKNKWAPNNDINSGRMRCLIRCLKLNLLPEPPIMTTKFSGSLWYSTTSPQTKSLVLEQRAP